jgi:transketolase
MSHWALEDIAVMRSLPNMAVYCPKDAESAVRITNLFNERGQPSYMRLTRNSSSTTNSAIDLHIGATVFIIATGGQMCANAVLASEHLNTNDVQVQPATVNVINPISESVLPIVEIAVREAELIITVEEHSRIGGLGSAVAEVLAGLKQHPPLVRLGTGDEYPSVAMSYEKLLSYHHLDVDSIVKEVLDALR